MLGGFRGLQVFALFPLSLTFPAGTTADVLLVFQIREAGLTY